ncbi:TPA: glycosyltransferase family 4 protein [Photobacterium damselae]|uniref:glycosyltransferase family 4 protein n=1 Tax=Photobacterium damselae TaxID=38293 RepID=UPI0040698EC7
MIYQVIDSRNFGGIESHILQLACLLHRYNYPVTIVFMRHYSPAHPLRQQAESAKIPVLTTAQLPSFYHLKQGDILHGHGYKASLFVRIYGLFSRAKVITTFHAGEIATGKVAFYEWLNRSSAFLSKNIVISQAIGQKISARYDYWHNFISLPKLPSKLAKPNKIMNVAFVGRLEKVKGFDRFCVMANALPQYQFHVFGDGMLHKLIPKHIHDHGMVSAMDGYWSQLDVLLIPSRAEGLPMAAIEAMANQVIVIATNVGDLAKLLAPEFLVPNSNWQQLSILLNSLNKLSPSEWKKICDDNYYKIQRDYSEQQAIKQLKLTYGFC